MTLCSLPKKDLDKALLANENEIMDLFPDNKPCSILVQLGLWPDGPSLTTPTNGSWHKLRKKAMGYKAMHEVKIQRTRISVWWFHFTKLFRWWLELTWHKVLYISCGGIKLGNQTKLLHHVQDVFLDMVLLNIFWKHVINKFHAEDAVLLKFLPVLGMYRLLKNIQNNNNSGIQCQWMLVQLQKIYSTIGKQLCLCPCLSVSKLTTI